MNPWNQKKLTQYILIAGLAPLFSLLPSVLLLRCFRMPGARRIIFPRLLKSPGLAEKNFVSDLIVWSGSFSRKMMSMQEAFAALKKDADAIQKYLIGKGVAQKDIVFSAVNINKEYRNTYDNNGRTTGTFFDGYTLTQSVDIESKEVDKIEAISREVTELINTGIEFNSSEPRYYYTKLAELKLKCLLLRLPMQKTEPSGLQKMPAAD